MKMSKKIVAFAAVAAMVVTAIPMSQGQKDVKAAAFDAVALYDFESNAGLSSAVGSTPTLVQDADRGSQVLKFGDGASSKIVTAATDSSLEEHSYRVDNGSPSSYKIANPYDGKSLSGATIAMWVKVPTEKAAGITSDGEVDETLSVASGLVGFLDSTERKLTHPDWEGGHTDQLYSGRTLFGINAQPCVYFNQIHHNSISSVDSDASMADAVGQWKYLAVSITNKSVDIYIDGAKVKGTEVNMGKRFLGSDEYENAGNEGMPFLLDFLCNNMSYTFGGKAGTVTKEDATSHKQVTFGKIESAVSAYIGFTGFSGTQDGVCIDDLAFFTQAYGAGDMAALFEAAKSGGITGGSGGGGSSADRTGGSKQKPSAVDKDAAVAIASATKLVSAPEGVTIGTPIPILKGDAETGGTFDALKEVMDSGLAAILATNPDWKDLKYSDNIYIQDIPLTGRELVDGEKAVLEMPIPEGFDVNMLWVLRINDDGTLTKCNIVSMENGVLQFETDRLCKFAIVQMTTGSGKITQAGAVSTSVFVLFGAAAVAGGACLLKRKKED